MRLRRGALRRAGRRSFAAFIVVALAAVGLVFVDTAKPAAAVSLAATIDLTNYTSRFVGATGGTVSPDGSKLVAGGSDLVVTNTATNAVIGSMATGSTGWWRTFIWNSDGTRLYAWDSVNVWIISFSGNSFGILQQVSNVGYGATGETSMVLSPDGASLYVVSYNASGGAVPIANRINTSTYAVTGFSTLDSYPVALALNSDGSKLYIGSAMSGSLGIVNTSTMQLQGTSLATGQNFANRLISSSDRSRLYSFGNTSTLTNVVDIDTATNTVASTTSLGMILRDAALSADDSTLAVIGEDAYPATTGIMKTFTASTMAQAGSVNVTKTTGYSYSNAIAVSSDGSRVFGTRDDSGGVTQVMSWATSGTTVLTQAGGSYSNGIVASSNGLVGYAFNGGYNNNPVWVLAPSVSVVNVAGASPATQTVSAQKNVAMTPTSALTTTELAGAVTWTVSPSLPTGLLLDSSTGQISGTPTAASAATTYTLTGASSVTGTVRATVSLAVTDISPATQVIDAFVFGTPGLSTPSLTTSYIYGTVSYSISPTLPLGLTFYTSSGQITGSLRTPLPPTTYTITATGSTGGSAQAMVTLSAGSVTPRNSGYALTEGIPFASNPYQQYNLPSAATFAVTSGTLPTGLTLNSTTGVISGTPATGTASTSVQSVTVTATVGSYSANLNVALGIGISGRSIAGAPSTLTGTAGTTTFNTPGLTLSGFGAGTPSFYMYGYPSGTTFSTTTGALTGSVTAGIQVTGRLIRASTSSSDIAWVPVTTMFNSAGFGLSYSSAQLSGSVGSSFSTSAPVVTGTSNSGLFEVQPPLPPGLVLNPATGAITGTPTAASPANDYLVSFMGYDGGWVYAGQVIQLGITSMTPTSQEVFGSIGVPITATSAFTTPGLVGAASYSISPALPPGLLMSSSTGVISGTPTSGQSSTSYTVTAAGATSGVLTSTVTIAVASINAPNQTVTATYGTVMTPTGPIAATGFNGAVSYAISPSLPAGLTLNTSTGAITGNPSEAQAARTYTVTAVDVNSGVASTTFSLAVAPVAPAQPTGIITSVLRGQVVVQWTPGDTGGSQVTYTVTANPGGASCTSSGNWCVVTGLTAGTSHTFSVEASNTAGSSTPGASPSVLVSSTALPLSAPSASQNVTLAITTLAGTSVSDLVAGASYIAVGAGFAPNSFVDVVMYSTPTALGSTQTNGQGGFSWVFVAPNSLALGTHTLVALGVSSNGASVANAIQAVALVSPVEELTSALARTGTNLGWLAGVALLMMAIGSFLRHHKKAPQK